MQSLYSIMYWSFGMEFVISESCCKGTIWQMNYDYIFTFSIQTFNESLDFCNRSWTHELHKFDWQLPSSLAHAIGFKHQTHLPEVILVLWLKASHTQVARAKQASCLLHWLSMFILTVPLFRFTLQQHRYYDYILTLKAPITTAADDKFCDIFPDFQQK